MLIPTDVGYIALLTVLVVVPTAAVVAAVVDRMLKRRRNGLSQQSSSPTHAFPVVTDPHLNPTIEPRPVQVICQDTTQGRGGATG